MGQTHLDVVMSKLPGDGLNGAHDVIEEPVVDLLVERLVLLHQRDLQQLHQRFHRRAL